MRRTCLAMITLALAPIQLASAQADETTYVLEKVKPDLYRFVAGSYRSMVWVGDEEILLIDTLNTEAATWLKKELDRRFALPVRYVVYSHNHHDHAYGAEVFDDPNTVFVAHEMAAENLAMSGAQTILPDITFEDELALKLDGETLRLRYHGPNNGYGSVSMHFEDQDVMFVVDWALIGRMPYEDMKGYDIEGMIRSTKDILKLDWDTFVGGHADIGGREGVEHYLGYITELYDGVRNGMIAGQSLETLQADLRLDAYSDLRNYEDWRAQNIAGVYRILEDRSYMLMRPEVADPTAE